MIHLVVLGQSAKRFAGKVPESLECLALVAATADKWESFATAAAVTADGMRLANVVTSSWTWAGRCSI